MLLESWRLSQSFAQGKKVESRVCKRCFGIKLAVRGRAVKLSAERNCRSCSRHGSSSFIKLTCSFMDPSLSGQHYYLAVDLLVLFGWLDEPRTALLSYDAEFRRCPIYDCCVCLNSAKCRAKDKTIWRKNVFIQSLSKKLSKLELYCFLPSHLVRKSKFAFEIQILEKHSNAPLNDNTRDLPKEKADVRFIFFIQLKSLLKRLKMYFNLL